MISKKILALLAVMPVTAGVVTVAAVNSANLLNKVDAATMPTNTRRIWIIDNNNTSDSNTDFWTGSTLYAYYWNANGSNTIKVENNPLPNYYEGLWYFDVSLEGATSELNVILRVGNSSGAYGWGDNNQTFTQPLGAFGVADTIWLNGGVTRDDANNRNSRNASIGTTNGFSAGDLATILSSYDTCSDANTNGYNSYPQMKTNFFDKTDVDLTTTIVSGTYSVQDYIDGMSTRYTKNNNRSFNE